MRLHELHPAPGSRRKRTRVGRGISAGRGKTSGRGQKGQGSRESNSVPKGFEGGQMKQSMRLPKLRGFHNRFRREYQVVNLSKLNRFDRDAIVDGAALAAAGLVTGADAPVKLLAAGRVKVAVHVRVHRASAAARTAVEAAGGRVDLLEEPKPPRAEKSESKQDNAASRRKARNAAAADDSAEDTASGAQEEPQA
ncbi:MAG: 50S ribosomal protein L15 [Candidatus Dormibacteraeota bacterium]|uniref:Large ribosomal subunit protein uL15 n=1 Tax=Candidatus Aeolococcus gillhamiae TaxID=3127015 RepID=A0A2W5ZDR9_9BACT|nr:50S ribosomal protein L15 [Candidatus Dormibacteraeota bacterium]PZR81105.1 MAG: 50S ribosomal protein L15 [Candidatus Dormibacter sp. RRmetagenome_bin12]